MRIAVEGCAHGELEIIYDAIIESEKIDGKKVDLLLCCGDFQATRNLKDLKCMAVPDKYKDMGTFYKYYTGEKVAPCLTIFIGGNHEASNHLQELAYGGWAAPNIYYLGYANVINVAGIRIAGLSGIYKSHDLMKGHYEFPPYNDSSIRSAYHIRNLEIFRLKQISSNIDVFLTHDWPLGITDYGNVKMLLRKKGFLKDDIESNSLGSPPAMELLKHHYPCHWFSAHLHCKFAAVVPKEDNSKATKFLALDKCLPRRKFLQIVEVEHDQSLPIKLSYDLEWLTILFLTNHLLSIKNSICYMPGPVHQGRWNFIPTEEEKERIHHKLNYDLTVPLNFKKSVEPYDPESRNKQFKQPNLIVNDQTTEFCNKLGIDDPFALLKIISGVVDESENDINTSSFSTPDTPSTQNDLCTDLSYSSDDEQTSSFIVDTSPSLKSRLSMTPLKLPAPKSESTISINDDSNDDPQKQNEISPLPNIQQRLAMTPLRLPDPKGDKSTLSNNEDDSQKQTQGSSSSNFSRLSKSSLKLPSPKNESSLLPDYEEDSQTQTENNSSSKSSRSFDEIENESSTGAKAGPDFKKFKRRNQAIYTDTECVT